MIKEKDITRGEVLRSQLLSSLQGVEHYCSLRVSQAPEQGVWLPHQVHGTDICVVESADVPTVDADAVITHQPGLWVGVRTADCVPVLVCDPKQHVAAAIHAGWRGTVAHIVRLTVEKMLQEGCQAADLYAAVGPSISPEAFEVGEEVASAFVEAGRGDCVLRELWGPRGRQPLAKPHVDLWQSNVMDLLDCGLALDHIDCTPWCTFTHDDELFSARRQGVGTGRNVSAIQIQC